MIALVFCLAQVTPGATWETRTPEETGLSRARLDELRDLVGGRGCVVHKGYLVYSWGDVAKSSDVASAFKPVLSTLLLMAVQDGKLKGMDEKLSDVEPRLTGKNEAITWRHLAFQTSGYGLSEEPGEAYSYNDYALALYYDTLMQKIYKEDGTAVLRKKLGEALQFEDKYTFEAFGPKDRPGRLALSVRDFARFGLLVLRGGVWGEKRVIDAPLLYMSISTPLPPETPVTDEKDGEMIAGQRTIGGKKTITKVGPGYYSYNWWLNRTDAQGRMLYVDAPGDAVVASGHGGMRTLWILPGLDLVVSWNDSKIDDHDKSPGNPDSKNNRAARLMVQAAGREGTKLGVNGAQFTVNGKPTFLLGCSMYSALGESDEYLRKDLDDLQKLGFNWIRVWATWAAFENDVSAVDPQGLAREPYMGKLRALVAECDRRGMIVDVTLSKGNGVTGPLRLQDITSHRRAAFSVALALSDRRNWYLDLSNERNVKDKRFASMADLKNIQDTLRAKLGPWVLLTASQGGDIERDELREYLETAKVDFISPHRPRTAESAARNGEKTKEYLAWMKELGRVVPVHDQEPFRRGYGKWSPKVEDYLTDLKGAREGGAAGWCFHNGDERGAKDGVPRRSFDLREKRLFDQLDDEERKFLELLRKDGK